MRIYVAWLKSLKKGQKMNSTEPDDTATTAVLAWSSAPDIAKTSGAAKELDPEIIAAE